MNNILFVGPYRQNDGWGIAARAYIQALVKAGYSVSIKPIYMGASRYNISADLVDLEYRSMPIDIVIQNVLPDYMEYIHGVKNVGLLYLETNTLTNSYWQSKISLMDYMFVASETERNTIINSGAIAEDNVYCVPMPLDYNEMVVGDKHPDIPQDKYIFYFIGEYIHRKNLESLIVAFHTEFKYEQDVALVIKVNKTGYTPHKLFDLVTRDINHIKQKMGMLPNLHKDNEFLICSFLDQKEYWQLHNSCDCFVMPSRGESVCRPALEACVLGKSVLVTERTGMADLLDEFPNAKAITSIETPCLTPERPLKELYTHNDTWQEPIIGSLMQNMRDAYNHRETSNELRHSKFSIESVAKTIRGITSRWA